MLREVFGHVETPITVVVVIDDRIATVPAMVTISVGIKNSDQC